MRSVYRRSEIKKHFLSYLARTDPRDVARVESKTLICTPEQREAIPTPAHGVQGTLGKWQDPDSMMESLNERFNGCMEGLGLLFVSRPQL